MLRTVIQFEIVKVSEIKFTSNKLYSDVTNSFYRCIYKPWRKNLDEF